LEAAVVCTAATLLLESAALAQTSVITPRQQTPKASPAANLSGVPKFPRAKLGAAPQSVAASGKAENLTSSLRRRTKGSRDRAAVPDGLYLKRAASGLGEITALTSDNEGQLFALNKAGSIFVLYDRAMDGRMDTQRVLTAGLDAPSGLAFAGGFLYVADQSAIWQIDIASGARKVFVPLTNIKAGPQRPLIYYQNKLVLGLSDQEIAGAAGKSKVLSIDMGTRRANLLTEIPGAPLRALSIGGGQIWAAAGENLWPLGVQNAKGFQTRYPLETGAPALAVLLPSKEIAYPPDWPAALREHIIAVQGPAGRPSAASSGGNNVVSLPTLFGAPGPELLQLVGGFTGKSGQSAWAAPSAILMEPRGLFIADRLGGSLYRLSADNRPVPRAKKPLLPPIPAPVKQKPSRAPNDTPAMAGSSLLEASHLETASTLSAGSLLKKRHEEKEQSKAEEKKRAEAEKLEAKAEAREARERQRKESIARLLKKNHAASGN
jgi:hypothetical protein